jgi:GDP-L-fucose synthase
LLKLYQQKKNKKNELILWGSGRPKRELMYVDDLADACIYFLNKETKDTLINIGTSRDKSIFEYAKFILKKINYKCKIILDKSKPDGVQRKIIDNSIALSYGWQPKISLDEGLELTLKSYFS